MTLRRLFLALALAVAHAAAAAPEPGVVQVDAPAPGDADWSMVEDARGGTGLAQALQSYLQEHPHGLGASRALQEQAAADDDLGASAKLLERARVEGAGREAGSTAALSEAKLDYAMGDPSEALRVLAASDAWPKPAALGDEWLFCRAQCRLLGKGYAGAREDLRALLAAYPSSPRAEAALAARAECDAVLKDDALAEAAWQQLGKSDGPFTAQALWGLAQLRRRQGKAEDAKPFERRLVDRYPASFEAHAAARALAAGAPPAAPNHAQAPAKPGAVRPPARAASQWWVQVGAYAKRGTAQKERDRLRAHRWRAAVSTRVSDGHRLYLVRLGPFQGQAQALAFARRLAQRERLDPRVVPE